MAQAAKPPKNLLVPSPKDLDKALALSADRARRMAEAFGLKVPAVVERQAKAPSPVVATRRKAYA